MFIIGIIVCISVRYYKYSGQSRFQKSLFLYMMSSSGVSSSGSFFEEATFGKTFSQCLILGGLWDSKSWSQLLLYPLFIQALIRAHQYKEVAVIAGDGDHRVFRRLLRLFCDEINNAEGDSELSNDKVSEAMAKYKEYDSLDSFLSVHGQSAATTDPASVATPNSQSIAVFISQYSDFLLDTAFPSSIAGESISPTTSLPSFLRQCQQLPRLLGHIPSSSSASSAAAAGSSGSLGKGPTRKLHIFAACCTSILSPTTVRLVTGLFPTVVHIRPNEGTYYASTVAAEVHTVRRADGTQKITENTELFVFGPCLPSEKLSSSHASSSASNKGKAARTASSSASNSSSLTANTSTMLFLWPLAVPPSSSLEVSESSSSSAVATIEETKTTNSNATIITTNTATMGSKRLITFDRSDPEFDEDDDPDADLDL